MATHDREEQSHGMQETAELNNNVVFEVLRRVDAVTLAAASCVNRNFRSVAEEEDLWERLCNDRWPSSKDATIKSILASIGGHRKMYADCYPSIINKKPRFLVGKNDYHDRLGEEKASDFISIVDVVYGNQSLLSRIVDGIPGAEDCHEWFSSCPFRIDLLALSENEYRDQSKQPGNMITIDLPYTVSRFSGGLKNGTLRNGARIWKMLVENMRVSWILINKNSKQMVNLASWKPLGGFRHWLCEEDFLMRFGSVLPGSPAISDSSVGGSPVQCTISLVCSLHMLSQVEVPGESVKATLRLSELGLQLEDFEGALATGKESVAILHRALNCPRSRHAEDVEDSYQRYLKVRNENKSRNLRYEGRLNLAAALASGISSCLFIIWLMKF